MSLKLKTLLEGFAWEREPGKALPTLADTTAAYERKLAEQGYYDHERKRGKFGPGSRHNDEPDFNYSGKRDVIQNDKWDKLVDEYNNKPGYVVVAGAPRGLYMAKITNTETGDEWEIKFKYQEWTYQCKIGGRIKRFDSSDELINNFNENNGMQSEGADEPQYSYDDPDGIDFDDENWSDPFLDDPDFMDETAKPDYIDLDGDGNKKETMRKAAADKKSMKESFNQRILNNLHGSEYILKETFESGNVVAEGNHGDSVLDLVSRAEDMVQNLRSNMATNSVLQRAEKMGYLRAYDELLDILSDIGYQAEME